MLLLTGQVGIGLRGPVFTQGPVWFRDGLAFIEIKQISLWVTVKVDNV